MKAIFSSWPLAGSEPCWSPTTLRICLPWFGYRSKDRRCGAMSTAGGRWPPIFAGPGCVHKERTASRLVKRNRATRVCKGPATGKRSIFTAKSRHSGYGLIGPEDNAALLGDGAFDSESRAARTTAFQLGPGRAL
jgi:hypothetical protein